MPSFRTEVPNPLSKDAAIEKLKGLLDTVSERYQGQVSDVQGEWNDNQLTFSMKTYGAAIKATLVVEEDKATLEGELPFAMLAFRGKFEQAFQQAIEKGLASGQ